MSEHELLRRIATAAQAVVADMDRFDAMTSGEVGAMSLDEEMQEQADTSELLHALRATVNEYRAWRRRLVGAANHQPWEDDR